MGTLSNSIKSNSNVSSKRVVIIWCSILLTLMIMITGTVNIVQVIKYSFNDSENIVVFPEYIWTVVATIIVLLSGVNGTQSIFKDRYNSKNISKTNNSDEVKL